MSGAYRPPLLRLVHDRDAVGLPVESSGHFEPVQASLLGSGHRTLLVCTTDSLDERSFTALIADARPTFAFDLRATPRFDFGSLNRRKVLSLFHERGISYFDLGGELQSDEKLFDAFKEKLIESAAIEARGAGVTVIVFIDPRNDYRTLGLRFVRQLREATECDWEVVLYGPADQPGEKRHIVFISHANPEDNEFVLWLQARLTRHGYQVWSDLISLKAGETFWDTIEEVIRKKAAKILVVASRVAITKANVLDEIGLAVSVERSEKIEGFVIPLRLDLPFNEFRANIARKNAIDYSQSWSRGFMRTIEALKRDLVPRSSGFGQSELETWWAARKLARSRIEQKPEVLLSNQFTVERLPYKVFQLKGDPSLGKLLDVPMISHQGGWLTFLSANELGRKGVSGLHLESTGATSEVLNGNVSFVQHVHSNARQRLLHGLLNRQFEWHLKNRGLLTYAASNRPLVLYFPIGLVEKDKFEFVDTSGVIRRRKLAGYSEKRKIYWHLGLTGRFAIEGGPVMRLKLSVVFTKDGAHEVLPNVGELRRRFCKNWWNDRWRDMQSAAMAWLAQSMASIIIHDGECGPLVLSVASRSFAVPIGVREDTFVTIDPEVESGLDEILLDYSDDAEYEGGKDDHA